MAFPGGAGGGQPGSGGPQGWQNPGGIKPGPLQNVPGADLLLIFIIALAAQIFLPDLLFSPPQPGDLSIKTEAQSRNAGSQILAGMWFLTVHSLIVLGAVYFVIIRKHRLRFADLGIVLVPGSWITRAAIYGALMVPATRIVTVFLDSFSRDPFQNPQLDLFIGEGFTPGVLMVSLLVTGALVPLMEEIVFRGLFYGWLRGRMSLAASVAISSALFAFMHGIAFLIPIYALIGAVLALIAEKSGSVLTATVTHSVFNAINIMMLYWAIQSGMLQPGAG